MSRLSEEICLIGGGPVGCLMGILLARSGRPVKIFERRPDIRKTQIAAGRSINLALSIRGIHALEECGLAKEVLARAVPMYGRMMHSVSNELSFQRYGIDDSQYINSISRGELNRALLTRAENEKLIELHFQSRATAYDPDLKELTITNDETHSERRISAPIVIGCDGSASILREELKKRSLIESKEDTLDYGYKEFTIAAGANAGFKMEKNALHIWPRGSHMLIALPNFDGSFTCTQFLPSRGNVSFDTLSTPESMREVFRENFADALPLIEHFEETYAGNPTGHMVTVHSKPWTLGGQLLLVGDAAHAIVPFFGQGLNCGFEDCTLFSEALSKSRGIPEAFQAFAAARIEDANAIAELALDNFVEMRDKVGQKRFLLEKEIEKTLMKKFPNEYVSRYSMVTFSRAPYRLALKAGRIQDDILHQLSEGLTSPEKVDYALAKKLIETKLTPVIARGL